MSNSPDSKYAAAPGISLLKQEHPLTGSKDYEAAIDRILALALGQVRIFDRRLSRAYNDSARIELMRALLLSNRSSRIHIVTHDASNIRTDCARLVVLQRQFGHAVAIHRTQSLARGVYDPFVIIDGSHYARRFHYNGARGVIAVNDPEGAGDLVQRFNEIWEASQPAVTATTLGL
jgi:hypothetical protein